MNYELENNQNEHNQSWDKITLTVFIWHPPQKNSSPLYTMYEHPSCPVGGL